jgi:hypothetical protein
MSKEHFSDRHFTQAEAEAKVGKRIQTRVDFSGVPKGSTGTVISIDPAGTARVRDTAQKIYDVAIQWDGKTIQKALAELTNRLEQVDENENTIERYAQREQLLDEADWLLFIDIDKPLVDWFTKDEYEQYLEELTAKTENSTDHDHPNRQ